MSFDHKRAFDEVAFPAFEALSADMRTLATDCGRTSHRQDRNCDYPWPDEESHPGQPEEWALRARFDAMPAEELSWASWVVFFVGHWAPALPRQLTIADASPARRRARELGSALQRTGAYHIFSGFADQSLSERLGLPWRGTRTGTGLALCVMQGVLEVRWCTTHMYTRNPLTWATMGSVERVLAVAGFPSTSAWEESLRYRGNGQARLQAEDRFERTVRRCTHKLRDERFVRTHNLAAYGGNPNLFKETDGNQQKRA